MWHKSGGYKEILAPDESIELSNSFKYITVVFSKHFLSYHWNKVKVVNT
jgi:hypothetical protein